MGIEVGTKNIDENDSPVIKQKLANKVIFD
jgi:hypothetical protein